MMKLFKTLAAFALAATSMACTRVETGRIVLQGNITGNPGDVVVLSYLPGQTVGYHYPEVKDGRFEFTLDEVKGFADLIVSVGGVEFGARVDALDTLRMGFVVNKYLEDVEVSYDGSGEKESRIWADFYETYWHWSNYDLTVDRDESIPYEESLAKLERNDSLFKAKYKTDFNGYYKHRSELAHDLLKSIFLELMAYRDGVDPFEYQEYVAMAKKVDPCDPDQVVFPMVTRWMAYKLTEFDGNAMDKYVAFLKKYSRKLTDPDVNLLLARNMVTSCMSHVNTESPEIYEPFFAEIEKFAPESSELIAKSRNQLKVAVNSRSGSIVPDTILRTPDGQEIQFSSLFGKIIYADVWATWCGPCIKEGHYFRALAEKYKDNPRICFISLSIDDKDAPWLEFLAEEKPFWPQYRLDGTHQDDFCEKVGINSIPRFLLIDAEGKFIDADYARPSSEGIEKMLDDVIK